MLYLFSAIFLASISFVYASDEQQSVQASHSISSPAEALGTLQRLQTDEEQFQALDAQEHELKNQREIVGQTRDLLADIIRDIDAVMAYPRPKFYPSFRAHILQYYDDINEELVKTIKAHFDVRAKQAELDQKLSRRGKYLSSTHGSPSWIAQPYDDAGELVNQRYKLISRQISLNEQIRKNDLKIQMLKGSIKSYFNSLVSNYDLQGEMETLLNLIPQLLTAAEAKAQENSITLKTELDGLLPQIAQLDEELNGLNYFCLAENNKNGKKIAFSLNAEKTGLHLSNSEQDNKVEDSINNDAVVMTPERDFFGKKSASIYLSSKIKNSGGHSDIYLSFENGDIMKKASMDYNGASRWNWGTERFSLTSDDGDFTVSCHVQKQDQAGDKTDIQPAQANPPKETK